MAERRRMLAAPVLLVACPASVAAILAQPQPTATTGARNARGNTVTVDELVDDIRELRVYLDMWRRAGPVSHFFVLTDPAQRKRDIVRDLTDPDPSELHVSTGTEPRPSAPKRKRN